MFLMSEILFLTPYRDTVNVTVYWRNYEISFVGIMSILRSGPYEVEFEVLDEMNRVRRNGSLSQFTRMSRTLGTRYLCHYADDD